MFDVFNTFTVIITIKGSIIVDTITKPIMFVVPSLFIVFLILIFFKLVASLQQYKYTLLLFTTQVYFNSNTILT